jgi:hypothetical protein
VNFQPELRQPLLKLLQKPLRIGPVLKPGDQIVGVANDDHVAPRDFLPPDLRR